MGPRSRAALFVACLSRAFEFELDDAEWRQIQRSARAERTTVAEWVRRALRQARRGAASRDPDEKLAAIRAAARHAFPAPEIDCMNDEIARGYRDESDA